jgi:hypothetical protein
MIAVAAASIMMHQISFHQEQMVRPAGLIQLVLQEPVVMETVEKMKHSTTMKIAQKRMHKGMVRVV